MRSPAAEGSPSPNTFRRMSASSSVSPGASVYVRGAPGVPVNTRGSSEIVNVAGDADRFVT